ncbi:MAG: insulinase family protein [Clostridia bacterium]|nr:insulinase family protein [Clostridia bacterium]
MNENIIELKKGIKLHLIKTDLFKTNLACVIITTPLKREKVTLNTLIPFLLKRGTMNLKTQYEINDKLDNLYGSSYDCGIDKSGDNQVIKFYMEGIGDKFLPQKENLLKQNVDLLLELVFNPLLEDNKFKQEFLDVERKNLENIIKGKIDDKDFYAFNDCIEKMYGMQGFGLYKYGYLEDVEKIDLEIISNHYFDLIKKAKIDIFVSGDFDFENVEAIVKDNENIKKLNDREPEFVLNDPIKENKNALEKPNEFIEKMNVTQGKLILGLDVLYNKPDYKYVGLMYNAILGESANSKMFQNVREKAGLAYSARSSFVRQKKNIFIRCGIEIPNYEKANEIIKVQLDDMKQGNFSDEDIENAKRYLISGIKTIETEQDSQIVYYIGQELSNVRENLEEYMEKINKVSKKEIVEFANTININSVYFLKS